jgi:hypothetical protein
MEIEAKLVKRGESRYTLHIKGHHLEEFPRAVYPWDITKSRLSLENCEHIESQSPELNEWDVILDTSKKNKSGCFILSKK